MFLLKHVLLWIANALELLQSWWIVSVTFDDVIYTESYNKSLEGKRIGKCCKYNTLNYILCSNVVISSAHYVIKY